MDITTMLNGKNNLATPIPVRRSSSQQTEQSTSSKVSILPNTARNATGYPSPAEPLSKSESYRSGSETLAGQRPLSADSTQRNHVVAEQYTTTPTTSKPQTTNSDIHRSFSCATCGKGFARRSDLPRHERIHIGDRPHVCLEPNCGKPFIQRSALTVHMRVHSGEKPHMCERCGKQFSDSSSLARHRRIHSGKRPYKCPFADCQKTFTRRTTLTRHQNHHTGTVEEAAAATARALASRTSGHQRSNSDGTNASDTASQASMSNTSYGTPSPNSYIFRVSSPSQSEVPSMMPNLNRQTNGLSPYGLSDSSLPAHLRPGLQQPSPRSSPSASSPALSSFGGSITMPSAGLTSASRPSLTSHPNLTVLEPPAYRGKPSTSGSPHMSGPSPNVDGANEPAQSATGQSPPWPGQSNGIPIPSISLGPATSGAPPGPAPYMQHHYLPPQQQQSPMNTTHYQSHPSPSGMGYNYHPPGQSPSQPHSYSSLPKFAPMKHAPDQAATLPTAQYYSKDLHRGRSDSPSSSSPRIVNGTPAPHSQSAPYSASQATAVNGASHGQLAPQDSSRIEDAQSHAPYHAPRTSTPSYPAMNNGQDAAQGQSITGPGDDLYHHRQQSSGSSSLQQPISLPTSQAPPSQPYQLPNSILRDYKQNHQTQSVIPPLHHHQQAFRPLGHYAPSGQ